jgi:hypothetical protein
VWSVVGTFEITSADERGQHQNGDLLHQLGGHAAPRQQLETILPSCVMHVGDDLVLEVEPSRRP